MELTEKLKKSLLHPKMFFYLASVVVSLFLTYFLVPSLPSNVSPVSNAFAAYLLCLPSVPLLSFAIAYNLGMPILEESRRTLEGESLWMKDYLVNSSPIPPLVTAGKIYSIVGEMWITVFWTTALFLLTWAIYWVIIILEFPGGVEFLP